MKKGIKTFIFCLLLTAALPVSAFAQELVVGGQPVGIRIVTDGVLVAGVSQVETAEGPVSPAEKAGICKGDLILDISGRAVEKTSDFLEAVAELEGREAQVTVDRGGSPVSFSIKPALSEEGKWMMGIWLRDTVSGIGTLTFCDPESGCFGALGHGISGCDSGSAVPVPFREGMVSEANIVSIVPGTAGTPGELSGSADMSRIIGSVEKNDASGIYGSSYVKADGRTAETGEICIGPATLISTVNGRAAREYSVEINRIYNGGDGQHVMLTVTDPALQALTGGIVQGMSGSPIMQGGKLVGALTHVFVNDPSKGYGISIQDMLRAAGIYERAA